MKIVLSAYVLMALSVNSLYSESRSVGPKENLQSAIDRLQPGDTLLLEDGTYHQSVIVRQSGTAEKPITIKAKVPGKVTITGAMDKTPAFEKVSPGIYKAPWVRARFKSPGTDQIFVTVDGHSLYNCILWSEIAEFKGPGQRDPSAGPHGAPRESFYVKTEENNLYIRLLDDADPNTRKVSISRPDSGILLNINGQHHVAVEGLRFEVAPVAGIQLSTSAGIKGVTRENQVPSNNIAIRDCAFLGCLVGVKASTIYDGKPASPAKGTSDITIEHCQFSKYPAYEWERCGALHYGPMHSPMYNSTLGSQAIYPGGPATRWKIRHCYIHDQFDGIGSAQSIEKDPALGSEFAYNLIQRCCDDAIEFDAVEYSGIHVHHNFFLDNMVTFGFSPVKGGGIKVDHNIVYNSPEYATPWGVVFKFSTPNGFDGKDGIFKPLGGMIITNNTMIQSKCGVQWGTAIPKEGTYFRSDTLMADNIFYVNDWRWFDLYNPIRQGFVVDKKNLFCGPTIQPNIDLGEGFLGTRDTEPFVRRDTWRWDVLPPVLQELAREAKLGPEKEIARVNFAVNEEYVQKAVSKLGLPAAEFQSQAAKLGAAPPGTDWKFPRPGPRWAVGDLALEHPPFPPSLDPWWVGFADKLGSERSVTIRPWLCEFRHERGNLARWATVTASDYESVENPTIVQQRRGFGPGNVIDDLDDTTWKFKGDADNKAWLEMDLGSEMTFNYVELKEIVALDRVDVKIKRGTEWVPVHSFDILNTKPSKPPAHHKVYYFTHIPPTTARYVRFEIKVKPVNPKLPKPVTPPKYPVDPQIKEIRLLNEDVAK